MAPVSRRQCKTVAGSKESGSTVRHRITSSNQNHCLDAGGVQHDADRRPERLGGQVLAEFGANGTAGAVRP